MSADWSLCGRGCRLILAMESHRRTQKGLQMDGKHPGSVYKRCGCRECRAGLRRGASCSRLREDGHGSQFFSLDLPRRLGGARRGLPSMALSPGRVI